MLDHFQSENSKLINKMVNDVAKNDSFRGSCSDWHRPVRIRLEEDEWNQYLSISMTL